VSGDYLPWATSSHPLESPKRVVSGAAAPARTLEILIDSGIARRVLVAFPPKRDIRGLGLVDVDRGRLFCYRLRPSGAVAARLVCVSAGGRLELAVRRRSLAGGVFVLALAFALEGGRGFPVARRAGGDAELGGRPLAVSFPGRAASPPAAVFGFAPGAAALVGELLLGPRPAPARRPGVARRGPRGGRPRRRRGRGREPRARRADRAARAPRRWSADTSCRGRAGRRSSGTAPRRPRRRRAARRRGAREGTPDPRDSPLGGGVTASAGTWRGRTARARRR
jgi:hypothetical protein